MAIDDIVIRKGKRFIKRKSSYEEHCMNYSPDMSCKENALDYGSRANPQIWKCKNYTPKDQVSSGPYFDGKEFCIDCKRYSNIEDFTGPHIDAELLAERQGFNNSFTRNMIDSAKAVWAQYKR